MFNCKITQQCNDCVLLYKDYDTLKDICKDLGLTYQQVADLSSRKEKKKYQEFKYFPNIEITRVNKNRVDSKDGPHSEGDTVASSDNSVQAE